MKSWKLSIYLMLAIIIVTSFASCANDSRKLSADDDNILHVKSVYGDLSLSPGSPYQLTEGWDDGENPFLCYYSYVDKTDNFTSLPEQLIVVNKSNYTDGAYEMFYNPIGCYGYTENCEVEWLGSPQGIYSRGQVVIKEEYIAFLPYHNKMAIITNSFGNNGCIWLCEKSKDDGSWTIDPTPVMLGSKVICFYYPFENNGFYDPPANLLIATQNEIVSISLGGWLTDPGVTREHVCVSAISVPPYWNQLHVLNLTQIGDTIYVGEHFGVLKIEMLASETTHTFYPIDYQAIMRQRN